MFDFISSVHFTFNFGVAGGVLLLADMILFAALAAFWEQAGRVRLRPRGK